MNKAGQKILDGLKDAIDGNFTSVTIDGQRWERRTFLPYTVSVASLADGKTCTFSGQSTRTTEMIERIAKAIIKEGGFLENRETMGFAQRYARAAIEAMREPTEAMLQANGDDWHEGDASWRRMIDAALPPSQAK